MSRSPLADLEKGPFHGDGKDLTGFAKTSKPDEKENKLDVTFHATRK